MCFHCLSLHQTEYDYRQAVKKAVPHLQLLDDEPLTEQTGGPRRSASAFEEDWRLITELMQESDLIASDEGLNSTGGGTCNAKKWNAN